MSSFVVLVAVGRRPATQLHRNTKSRKHSQELEQGYKIIASDQ